MIECIKKTRKFESPQDSNVTYNPLDTMEQADFKPPRYRQVKNIYNHAGKTIRVVGYKYNVENCTQRNTCNSKLFMKNAIYCNRCNKRCIDPIVTKNLKQKSKTEIQNYIRYDTSY